MLVETETDALPIVKVVAALFRRSLSVPGVASRTARVKGVAALKSATDPQAATFRLLGDRIEVERGVATDAAVVITADLNDSSVKPKVEGAARHPALALTVGKLLEPPIGPWRVETKRFMEAALKRSDCPKPIRVNVAGDATYEQYGGDGQPAIDIYGASDQLASSMAGSSLLIESVLAEDVSIIGDLRDLSTLTGYGIANLFGEL
ncbi:MAG: hypothetical protein GXP35_09200 [Actinobacteria bacterium]|nr:hypothetical protein [Actinomycetota bacterium]